MSIKNPALLRFISTVIPFLTLIIVVFICTIWSNHVCDFVEVTLDGDKGFLVFMMGLWKGQIDYDELNNEGCGSYINNPYDRNWRLARAFSVISDILSICVLILTCELLRMKYDYERRIVIAVTCIELAFAKGFTLLFINSSGCKAMSLPDTIPEQYKDLKTDCKFAAGYFITVFTIPLWILAALLAIYLPLPSDLTGDDYT